MKLLVLALSVFATSNALDPEFVEKFIEKVQGLAQVCTEETHSTDDDIAELIDAKIPTSKEGKCLIFCLQTKMHLMKEDGTIDKVGAVLALDALREADFEMYKTFLGIFANCGDKTKISDDPCDTAARLAACGRDEAIAAGLDASLLG